MQSFKHLFVITNTKEKYLESAELEVTPSIIQNEVTFNVTIPDHMFKVVKGFNITEVYSSGTLYKVPRKKNILSSTSLKQLTMIMRSIAREIIDVPDIKSKYEKVICWYYKAKKSTSKKAHFQDHVFAFDFQWFVACRVYVHKNEKTTRQYLVPTDTHLCYHSFSDCSDFEKQYTIIDWSAPREKYFKDIDDSFDTFSEHLNRWFGNRMSDNTIDTLVKLNKSIFNR